MSEKTTIARRGHYRTVPVAFVTEASVRRLLWISERTLIADDRTGLVPDPEETDGPLFDSQRRRRLPSLHFRVSRNHS